MQPMYKDLPGAVLAALRGWYTGQQEESLWREMLVVCQEYSTSDASTIELAVKQVLLDALRYLEEHGAGEAAQLLRLRFLDCLTAAATANRLNLTTDVVYKRQRTAVQELAKAVWKAEVERRRATENRVLNRLEIKDPPRLFGVDDKMSELTAALISGNPPWLVAVVGIGGIGKTSLADAIVRALSISPAFADIAWISARQERFTMWGGIQDEPQAPPALTIEGLVDALIEQLGFQDLSRLPMAQKKDLLRTRLRVHPYLVVVDNLETAADYGELIPELLHLVRPTKFLLTSRYSLHDRPGTLSWSLDELSAADSLALMRHEAGERGLVDLSEASDELLLQIHQVAGGNPLALKLLVGQLHTLSLPQVLDDLREARGKTIEELYRFIYWRSWQLLSDQSRQLLTVMPLVAESGGSLEQMTFISELDPAQMRSALSQLVALCLVNVQGTLAARRYSVHRLTETFLLNEVLRWQAQG